LKPWVRFPKHRRWIVGLKGRFCELVELALWAEPNDRASNDHRRISAPTGPLGALLRVFGLKGRFC
jgi:hypothetical protein